ncbi:MAG TPA: pyruvate formate lyase family protein, partial [Lentisphaeria bacterium]|nr:pyruvate formate lyase family protein [Lentisphaeria bacterium]
TGLGIGSVVEINDRHAVGYMVDFSHTCPDWQAILKLGFPGLRDRAASGDTPFHQAAAMTYDGAMILCRRLGAAAGLPTLSILAERPPKTLHEAFQLAYLFHDLQEMEGESVRTMGWFDRLYIDFYRNDLAAGILTREQASELIKYFWIGFYAKTEGKLFGKNFCFGPKVNELSYLGMEVYHELNTVDPKLSVRLAPDTPNDFLQLTVKNIRDGRNGIVFLNNDLAVNSLIRHGRTPEDAADFIPIGCYEPAVLGKEISISGATHVYLPQVVLLTLAEERDYVTFDEVLEAFLERLRQEIDYMVEQQRRCERIWPDINPAPFLSGTMAECVTRGRDITAGGARYNTTGCIVNYFADAVDSLAAIEHLVFKTRQCTMAELRQALADNWQGHEELQLKALNRTPKWGNGDDRADRIGVTIAEVAAERLNTTLNARGGRFTAALFGQLVVERGRLLGALPSGRLAGTPAAKNLCACIGMDREGITALMNSVLKIDLAQFPNGVCLDLMLHPSAVQGLDGIANLAAIARAFLDSGGSGLQFNIFSAETLRDAQAHPEKYANLQVRVCGWNVRFTDLTPAAQNTFIAQAEAMS